MNEESKRERVRDIERTMRTLHEQLGEPSGDPRDYGDSGQDLMNRDEYDAQIVALDNERRGLLESLGEDPGEPPVEIPR